MTRRVRRPSTVTLALAAVLAGSAATAFAQEPSSTFLGAGYGVGARRHGSELASGVAELVFQRHGHHVAVRGVAMGDLFGGSGDSFGEVGLLYGRAAHGPSGHVALAAGVALTSTRCNTAAGAPDECALLGFPIVAEASVRIARPVGVGVQAFANVNRKTDYGGLVVLLSLGPAR